MGVISIEQLLPKHIFRPDDASPISALGFPARGKITRIGFERKPGQPLSFEGETPVKVRLTERTWQFRLKGAEKEEKKARGARVRKLICWRLEILVDARESGSLRPRHEMVVAQTPYSNGWVQSAALKKYSKKKLEPEEIESKLHEFDDFEDVEKNLEAAHVYDPWEKSQNYVAGISFPRNFVKLLEGDPRNAGIDYVIGICPDFNAARNELMMSPEIQRLEEMTEKETIAFWKLGKPERTTPRLYAKTKAAAPNLLTLAILQALAGPRKYSKEWENKPVWKLVEYLYCNHLNNCNRKNKRRRGESQFSEQFERQL